MTINMAKTTRAAASAKDRIRDRLKSERERLKADGRRIVGLDRTMYIGYAIEMFLRHLARHADGEAWVLKGANAFGIWQGGTEVDLRPTFDVDLHRTPKRLTLDQMKDLFFGIVGDPGFIEQTGLFVIPDTVTFREMQMGTPEQVIRIDATAVLGDPADRDAARIPLCIESSSGTPPDLAVRKTLMPSRFQKKGDEPVMLAVTSPEWMAADKLHSIATRGQENTRIKDWWDLLRIGRLKTGDPSLAQACLRYVFEIEHAGEHTLPRTALEIEGLRPGFATQEREMVWQNDRFPAFTGIPTFDAEKHPSFRAVIAAAASALEAIGMLESYPEADAARALAGMLNKTSVRMEVEEIASLVSAADDPNEIAFRFAGELALAGRQSQTIQDAYNLLSDNVNIPHF